MQAALKLGQPDPAAGAQIVAGLDRLRAGPAADAGVVLLVQIVVGDVVLVDIVPDVGFAPVDQGRNLHHAVLFIPAQHRCAGARGRLVSPQRGDPGGAAFERLGHGHDFANVTTLVGVAAVELEPVVPLLLGNADVRRDAAEGAAVVALRPFDQGQRLGEEVVGVDVEDVDVRVDTQGNVHQRHAAGAEGGAHREAVAEMLDRPPQDLLGGLRFQLAVQLADRWRLPRINRARFLRESNHSQFLCIFSIHSHCDVLPPLPAHFARMGSL